MRSTTTASLLLLAAPAVVTATSYNLVKDYSGSTFFDGWNFYNNYDNLTNGDAIFVSAANATTDKLAYVDTTTNHAIIKVDNTTTVPFNDKRNTVRITSAESFGVGSVWVADMTHVPYGCSVWPAFWSQAPNWPTGGEIDTFEGVNQLVQNSMTLHTEPGCTQVSPVQSSTLVNSTDCSYESNGNQGCIVTDPSTASYGAGFAAAGGGVFVTEYASTGISIWFFSRSAVPSGVSSSAGSIDTSSLGKPVANWPSGGCNVAEFFAAQNLIFDITLCGDYAGSPAVFNETCTGVCYNDYVIGPPSNYDNAYFEVSYVRVYGNGSASTTSSNGAPATAAFGSWSIIGALGVVAATALLAL
ncbi:hypothetical protein HWV62_31039 [Athelia sp. TMB]|nr:hypothetical protein HWV62_31039 [Athelia sp. TMB]